MRNLKINKRIASFVVALGFTLCPMKSLADFISYNSSGAKVYGDIPATLYFTTGNNDDDYAYVSFKDKIGYVTNKDVNYYDFCSNNEFTEINTNMYINNNQAYLYQEPKFDNEKVLSLLPNNSKVYVIAQNKSGWSVILTEDYQTGFVYSKYLYDPNKEVNVIPMHQEVEGIHVAKITGNNVNIRNGASTKNDIIGFADKTDKFKILNQVGDWYLIDYLGQNGYVYKDYVLDTHVPEDEFTVQKMVYLNTDSTLYRDTNGTYLSTLPKYQNAFVLDEVNGYYKVNVDGVTGYINKRNTKNLTKRCVVVDLSRQTLKVFKNGEEVYRARIISGRESMQTSIGCFKVGHKMTNYQLTPSNFVKYWIQFNGNIGIHDASWQNSKNFTEVGQAAYNSFTKGNGKTYPAKHGSHGCTNMMEIDASRVYDLVRVNDNVLVIGPNDLVRDNIISKLSDIDLGNINDIDRPKVKKLTYYL